ncbi:BON domain-containing protein [Ferrovibrio sp.]|uniref:BON domain-containing protein n=1 Tax=Ferrovibrio sp. TaxID=1917215 RepID=UPI001B77D924|nr:BON domain-containing protein [Ferrovibrio sp.]MBP7063153.1 BON domain-containing protein [Ferrovibrio sp.]
MISNPTLRMFVAAAALLAATSALAACSSTPRQESTGEYVDSAAITTKVKAAILNEPSLKSLQISVETFKDAVQLSGFVDSSASRAKAGEITRNVEGVKSVKNDLVVK